MFHPNIYADGSICLDILQNQWSPIYDISAILTSIQSLLCDPNPASPANSEAARLYQENRREYTIRVKEIVEQSWQGDDDVDDDGEDGKSSKTVDRVVELGPVSHFGGDLVHSRAVHAHALICSGLSLWLASWGSLGVVN